MFLFIIIIFYKLMKFRNQARLCLATYNFETRIMLSLCFTFQYRYRFQQKDIVLFL